VPFPLWSGFVGSPLIYGNQPTVPRLLAACVLSYYPNVSLRWLSDGLVHQSPVFYSFRCIHFCLRVLLLWRIVSRSLFLCWLPGISVHIVRIKSSVFILSRFKVLRSFTWWVFRHFVGEPPNVLACFVQLRINWVLRFICLYRIYKVLNFVDSHLYLSC